MLKTLTPKLMIKVVDACHAGVSQIKEADALSKQLQASKGSFSDCYFMFSSQSSQSSLQDSKLSDFTEAFVEACATFTGQDIRYKDIVDHISDAFVGNADQTPTFVIQAPCVEIFARLMIPFESFDLRARGAVCRQLRPPCVGLRFLKRSRCVPPNSRTKRRYWRSLQDLASNLPALSSSPS